MFLCMIMWVGTVNLSLRPRNHCKGWNAFSVETSITCWKGIYVGYKYGTLVVK